MNCCRTLFQEATIMVTTMCAAKARIITAMLGMFLQKYAVKYNAANVWD